MAQSAIDTLTDIAADGKITPDEKLRVLAEWNSIYAEFNPIHGLGANSLIGGINNLYCKDYYDYYNALEDYLFAGIPVILDTDVTSTVMRQTTVIDRDVFMDKFVDYYSYKALLQAQISGLGSTALSLLDDISSDGKITPDEKLTVLGIMDAIDAEFTPLYAHGEAVIGEKDEYGNQIDAALVQFSEARNLLHAYLFHPDNPATIDTILSASDAKIYLNGVETANYVMKTTTSITRSDFMYKFREYYAKKALVQTEINASISESLLEIEKIADDGWLTPAEKSQLSLRWKDIMSEFSSITGKCALYDMLELDAGQYVDEFYSQYYASYSGLNTYLTNVVSGILSVDVNITTAIDKAEFISKFQSYYDSREIIMDALDNKDKDSFGSLDYLKEALKTDPGQEGLPGTNIGLLWSKILLMRDSNLIQRGGMSGLDIDPVGMWTGGTYAESQSGVAKVILRKDGSGQLAGGKIKWSMGGMLEVLGKVIAESGDIGDFKIDDGDIVGVNANGVEKIRLSTGAIPPIGEITNPVWSNLSGGIENEEVKEDLIIDEYGYLITPTSQLCESISDQFDISAICAVKLLNPSATITFAPLGGDSLIDSASIVFLIRNVNTNDEITAENYTSSIADVPIGTYVAILRYTVNFDGYGLKGKNYTARFLSSFDSVKANIATTRTMIGNNGFYSLLSYGGDYKCLHYSAENGLVLIGLPTSLPSTTGTVWSDSGTLKIRT